MKFLLSDGTIYDNFEEAQEAETKLMEQTKEKEELEAKLDAAYDEAIDKIEKYADLYGQIYGVSGKDFLTLCSMVEDAKNDKEITGEPLQAGPLAAFLIDFFG